MAEQQTAASPRTGVTGLSTGFFTGVRFLLRGIGMYARSPGLMFLGLIPAVISFAVLVGLFLLMITFVDDLVVWMTPYAESWDASLRDGARLVVQLGIGGVWIVLSIVLFAALTLLTAPKATEAPKTVAKKAPAKKVAAKATKASPGATAAKKAPAKKAPATKAAKATKRA